MNDQSEHPFCLAHSGFYKELVHLKDSDKQQWTEINGMKKWLIATLTSSIISAAGIILILLINLSKG